MSRPFEVRLPLERAYTRESMFAVELLDAVTLQRVTQGVDLTAKGLTGKPIISFSGLFVWLKQDDSKFEKLVIEPTTAPFERVEIPAAQLARPLQRVELTPLANYPFVAGITALRGSLIESQPPPGGTPVPIPGATIRLEWLDDDGVTWHPWQAPALTSAAGEFTSILRLSPGQLPLLDAQGRMTVRLTARRPTGSQKQGNFQLPQGRVADETYAWDVL